MSPTAGEGSGGTLCLTGGSVLSPAGYLLPADLLIEEGRIASVGPGIVPRDCRRVIHLDGAQVAPGLIDLHIHGFAGVSPLRADGEALRRMDQSLAREGVTGYLIACSAAPYDAVAETCAAIAANGGTGCLGILLEGAFVNPKACGSQDPAAMVSPDAPDARRWLDLPGIRGVTIAPELPGALGLIRDAVRRGLVVSVGHTRADTATLSAARAAGARMITHFYNNGGAPSWTGREPGLLGAGLLDPEWWLEVIADGIHVHPDNLELLRRCRGTHQVCMVSDARSAAGLPDRRHTLGDGVTVEKRGSRLTTAAGTLAGGAVSLGAQTAAALAAGSPAVPLFEIGAANPARLLGLHPDRGAVAPGSRADLTAWNADGTLRLVVSAGRVVAP